MLGLEQLCEWWEDIFTHADPRVDGYPLMNSILWPIGVITIYMMIVCFGPSFVKQRKPMELRNIMLVYNFAMVAHSGVLCIGIYLTGWRYYSLGCEPVGTSRSPRALWIITFYYIFFLSKIIEFLDTVFFILRKKFDQLSFLHIFHHAIMPVTVWLALRFAPGGMITFTGLINSFVHFLLYLYYGLAALGPAYRKYIWWKHYLTAIQIVQFFFISGHLCQLFFIQCDTPIFFAYVAAFETSIFIVLFSHYWYKALQRQKLRKTLQKN